MNEILTHIFKKKRYKRSVRARWLWRADGHWSASVLSSSAQTDDSTHPSRWCPGRSAASCSSRRHVVGAHHYHVTPWRHHSPWLSSACINTQKTFDKLVRELETEFCVKRPFPDALQIISNWLFRFLHDFFVIIHQIHQKFTIPEMDYRAKIGRSKSDGLSVHHWSKICPSSPSPFHGQSNARNGGTF